jgi:hypothetical protein
MEISHRLLYDAHPGVVFDMLTDPSFRERVCRALGTASYDVSVDRPGGGAHAGVRLDLLQRTEGMLPAFAMRIVGSSTRVVQSETWRPRGAGGYEGDLAVRIPGRPGGIEGRLTLTRDHDCVEEFVGTATSGCPWSPGGSSAWCIGSSSQAWTPNATSAHAG